MPLISDIFDIPPQVHQGDFVLRLTEGVERPADTLSTYVVTSQLMICFDQALGLIKSALETCSSKGAYLHGSFGSGKSHFMAVLTLLLQRHPEARAIPELASVVTKHNAWIQGRRFLVVPYHMIGAISLESAVLGQYADYVRRRHPEAPTPGFYQGERLFADARCLRMAMGDEAFFAQLGRDQETDSGSGSLGSGWDAESFKTAMEAPPTSDERIRLVGDLIDAFFQSARDLAVTGSEGFVALDEGLSIMSKHAQALGYDTVVLFLDELILWLASHAGDLSFINREGQKVAKLVEAMTADRPIPIISFIARQRDLRELVGEHLPDAEHLGFADVLNWWEARFDQITLEDRNLPAIAEKRLLRPRSAEAAQQLQEAFQKTARVREEVMNTLLTRAGDRDMFRQVYPFGPALVQTLVAVSSLLQRERTALKLLLLLLINQRDSLELGDLIPVGDLFDVIAEGDEPFTQAMRINFDNAKKLYRQKLLSMLEGELGVTAQDVKAGKVEAMRAQRFRNDDRLLKTLILSALAPEVEALHAPTPIRLAALNHGTVRSPIPGQEGAIVLQRCRNWAAQVGEIKVSDDGSTPTISLPMWAWIPTASWPTRKASIALALAFKKSAACCTSNWASTRKRTVCCRHVISICGAAPGAPAKFCSGMCENCRCRARRRRTCGVWSSTIPSIRKAVRPTTIALKFRIFGPPASPRIAWSGCPASCRGRLWRTWGAWYCWTISCRAIISISTPGICRRSIASRRGCSSKTSAIRCASACGTPCWPPTASARCTWMPSIPRTTSMSISSRSIRR